MIITIDGPVASGKSTVAKLLAQRLGFYPVNTGLLYRAVAYGQAVEGNTVTLERCIAAIDYSFCDGQPVVCYHGQDVTSLLKQPAYDQPASIVSASPVVRQLLLPAQRSIGQRYNIVADGRDCGSVVYLDAEYKFFLTAPLKVRAARMAHELQQKTGQPQDVAAVCEQIAQRDKRDTERVVAPLRVPEGAVVIDNGDMTLEQTVEHLVGLMKK